MSSGAGTADVPGVDPMVPEHVVPVQPYDTLPELVRRFVELDRQRAGLYRAGRALSKEIAQIREELKQQQGVHQEGVHEWKFPVPSALDEDEDMGRVCTISLNTHLEFARLYQKPLQIMCQRYFAQVMPHLDEDTRNEQGKNLALFIWTNRDRHLQTKLTCRIHKSKTQRKRARRIKPMTEDVRLHMTAALDHTRDLQDGMDNDDDEEYEVSHEVVEEDDE